jgi:8-oxo-dGTP diphosphatase
VQVEARGAARRAFDAAARLAYRCAYRAARVWWAWRRPLHQGALAAIWCEGSVLLVKSSYRPRLWGLPGGGLRRGETPALAAARECREEVGLALDPAALTPVYTHQDEWESRPDRVHILELHVAAQPRVAIDHREIVAAEFVPHDEALARRLPPHLRAYLTARGAR